MSHHGREDERDDPSEIEHQLHRADQRVALLEQLIKDVLTLAARRPVANALGPMHIAIRELRTQAVSLHIVPDAQLQLKLALEARDKALQKAREAQEEYEAALSVVESDLV